ncbi:MAG: insulinase family protein, partial [Candidatus Xenobia bacterium]
METLSAAVSFLPPRPSADGLEVARFEMASAHTVALKWYVELGPWLETAELSGASHLLEHLLFMHLSPPGAPVIHTWVSDVDAATGIDYMVFSAVTMPEHLEAVLHRLCLLYRVQPEQLAAELPR